MVTSFAHKQEEETRQAIAASQAKARAIDELA